jgi:hypothetical protein
MTLATTMIVSCWACILDIISYTTLDVVLSGPLNTYVIHYEGLEHLFNI